MIGNWLAGLTAGVALPLISARWAQAGATGLEILAQGGVTIKQSGTRNWVVEILVIVVVIGLALFAICKSSRRV